MKDHNMRILMINDHIHFGGGGDAVFRLERKAYEESGYEVFTFSQETESPPEAGDCDFVAFESNNRNIRKMGKFLYQANVARSLGGVLRTVRPHFVSVHLVSKYPLSIYPLLQEYPVVQTLHGPSLFCATSWGCLKNGAPCELGVGFKCYTRGCVSVAVALLHMSLYKRLMGSVKRNVDLFVCPSKNIRASADSLGFTPTEFIPLGIDEPFINASVATHENRPIVLYIGALAEPKGVQFLLEAFRSVLAKFPEALLLIAGRGPMETELREKAATLGISESVQFMGFVKHTELVDLYRSADVLAVPSIWKEQFGLIGPEALACGIPCVGSDIGGIPEWLHDGKWGFTVTPRDSLALAGKLIALLENRGLRLSFGAKGRAYAIKQYSPDKYKENRLRLVRNFAKAENKELCRRFDVSNPRGLDGEN